MSNLRISLSLLAVGIVTTIALAQDPSKPPPPRCRPSRRPRPRRPSTRRSPSSTTLGPLKCKIHQEVDMLGEHFTIEGEYWHAGPYTFRLRLDVKGLPGSDGRMGQVSDGKVLWDYTELLDQHYYYRLDLPRAARTASRASRSRSSTATTSSSSGWASPARRRCSTGSASRSGSTASSKTRSTAIRSGSSAAAGRTRPPLGIGPMAHGPGLHPERRPGPGRQGDRLALSGPPARARSGRSSPSRRARRRSTRPPAARSARSLTVEEPPSRVPADLQRRRHSTPTSRPRLPVHRPRRRPATGSVTGLPT